MPESAELYTSEWSTTGITRQKYKETLTSECQHSGCFRLAGKLNFWGRLWLEYQSICPPFLSCLSARKFGISGISCGMIWRLDGRKTKGKREAGQTDRAARNEGGGFKGRVWGLKRKRSSLGRGKKEITFRVAGVEDCHCSLWERQTETTWGSVCCEYCLTKLMG